MNKLQIGVVMFTLSVSASAGTLMNPGKWSITVKTAIVGAPINIPSTTISKCITEEQAANPEPPKSDSDGDCQTTNYKIDDDVVTWLVKCEKKKTTGHGRITYHGNSFEGLIKLSTDGMAVTQTLTGTRVGDCDK